MSGEMLWQSVAGLPTFSDRMYKIWNVMAWEKGCLLVLYTTHRINVVTYYFIYVWTYIILATMLLSRDWTQMH